MKKIFKNQFGFSHFEAILLLLIIAAIVVVGVYVAKNQNQASAAILKLHKGPPVPSTATLSAHPALPSNANLMAGQLWMIKDNDLATIGNVGNYQWVGCGITTGATLTSLTFPPCQSDQTPFYTSEITMASDIANHKIAPGGYVIYDNESWSITPDIEKDSATFYEQKAIQLAHANGLKIINTPYAPSQASIIARDAAAASAGADVIDIQSQTLDLAPTAYYNFVLKAVNAIRAVNPNVIILAGLATDPGGNPTGQSQMYQAWKLVKPYVQGFWLNANKWTTHAKGCAASGCPATAIGFLKQIGAI